MPGILLSALKYDFIFLTVIIGGRQLSSCHFRGEQVEMLEIKSLVPGHAAGE